MHKNNLKRIILHPFLFGVYPVIALLGHNISEMRISEAFRAMFLMIFVVALIVIVLRLFFRNWQRAALATTLVVLTFFLYGYLYDFLQQFDPSLPIGRHRFLFPIYLTVIVIGLWWIKKIHDLDTATQILNWVGLVLLIFPLYQIVSHEVITAIEISKKDKAISSDVLLSSNDLVYPDIYYIILDSYAREDVLLDVYGHDNSEFLNQLREMGFYIADCSQSNYSKTTHSLSSTLNLNYLDVLSGGDVRDFQSPSTWIRFNEVKKILDSLGYTTVAFSTGYPATELTDVDIYLQPDMDELDIFGPKQPVSVFNNFEALLVSTSGLVLVDALTFFDIHILPQTERTDIQSIADLSPEKRYYATVLYAFNQLDHISSLPSPKFVFAHIIAPHKPYIFALDGKFKPKQEQNADAYFNQLSYVNQRVKSIVTGIIENSDEPPIIVIQADHGPTEVDYSPDRVKILNAYYLPNGGEQMLYSTITPVNTFRLILDTYFGSDYGLLEDASYFSKSEEDLIDFEVVPNLCDR